VTGDWPGRTTIAPESASTWVIIARFAGPAQALVKRETP
jgi:hypothetical protein